MNLKRKLYIFFDVDGVIISSEHQNPAISRPWDEALVNKFNINPKDLSAMFFDKFFIDILVGKYDLKSKLSETLVKLGYNGDVNNVVNCWFEGDAKINYSVIEIIEKLRFKSGVHLFLATNQEKYRADYIWNKLGLRNYFEDIFYSANLGVLKNDEQFYCKVNEAINYNKDYEKIIFIDDNKDNISTAIKSGWNAYLYKSIIDIDNAIRNELAN